MLFLISNYKVVTIRKVYKGENPKKRMASDLESKVESVQLLKQEHNISSLNALSYLRSVEQYEQLRAEVNQALKSEGIRFNLSDKKISNLCEAIKTIVKDTINFADFEHFREGPSNYFVGDFNPLLTRRPGQAELDVIEERTFKLDYNVFIADFARYLAQGRDVNEALRQAFLVFKSSQHPYLTTPNGEKVNFQELVQKIPELGEKRLRLEEITHNPEMLRASKDTNEFTESVVEDFREWEITGSKSYRSGILELEQITQEERQFFYGFSIDEGKPYDRAVTEQTLKRLETERNIALHFMIGNYDTDPEQKPEKAIVKTIASLTGALQRRRERYQKLIELKAPSDTADHARLSVDRTQYTLLAIKKNRKWLETVLSR